MPSETKRLRQLDEGNGRLKKIVADLSLDEAMLQDVIVLKPAMADYTRVTWRVSQSSDRVSRAQIGERGAGLNSACSMRHGPKSISVTGKSNA